jgi:hypothetical protein
MCLSLGLLRGLPRNNTVTVFEKDLSATTEVECRAVYDTYRNFPDK